MSEPTKAELRRIYQDAYLRASEAGDPDRTFVSDCSNDGYLALYRAGRHSRDEEIARLTAELATEKAAVADYVRLWEELTNKVSGLSARADENLDAYQSCLDDLAETKALLLGAEKRAADLEALVASAQEDRARAVADLAQEARGGEEARAALTGEERE